MALTEEIFSYRRLVVYQHSRKYVKDIYSLTKNFPREELFALSSQMRRAAVSITSNIAEAMGRFSDKDKLHFIEFAFGSLYETMSQIEVALDFNYITQEQYNDIEQQVLDISKMLSGLRNSLNRNL
ncbi:MAG: four helix bundle protein [Prevotella sp.]|nr:four helix bundle protein [Prevotella sp.]